MEITNFHSALKNASEHYEVTMSINGKTLVMDVHIENGGLDFFRESHKTRIWTTLSLDEKYAIEDEIQYYFK